MVVALRQLENALTNQTPRAFEPMSTGNSVNENLIQYWRFLLQHFTNTFF